MQTTKRFTNKRAMAVKSALGGIRQKIKRINQGGCGFFAQYLHEILTKKGFKCTILCLDSISGRTRSDHDRNLLHIHQGNRDLVHAYNHLCVKVGGYRIDAGNVEKIKSRIVFEEYDSIGEITNPDLHFILSKKELWNGCYNREQNGKLKRLLRKVLQFL